MDFIEEFRNSLRKLSEADTADKKQEAITAPKSAPQGISAKKLLSMLQFGMSMDGPGTSLDRVFFSINKRKPIPATQIFAELSNGKVPSSLSQGNIKGIAFKKQLNAVGTAIDPSDFTSAPNGLYTVVELFTKEIKASDVKDEDQDTEVEFVDAKEEE